MKVQNVQKSKESKIQKYKKWKKGKKGKTYFFKKYKNIKQSTLESAISTKIQKEQKT